MARIKSLHHVVVASADAEAAARTWAKNLGLRAEAPLTPPGSNLRLVRLPVGGGAIELAQALTPDHRLARFLETNGEGLFSIVLEVEGLDGFIASLRSKGVRVSRVESRPWEGTRVARVARESAHGVAIQLLERNQEQRNRQHR